MKNLLTDIVEFLDVDLGMFDINTMLTTTSGLTDEMKTYYSDYLIDIAWPVLIHDQFAQQKPIPKNGGKIIEFRKYAPLAKALTPISEGVTPSGQNISMSVFTAVVAQYGGYVTLSDMLMLTAIDDNMVQATELIGHQAGETADTITRNVINGGSSVQYGNARVLARYLLIGGDGTAANNHYFSVNDIRRAVRALKKNKAQKIDGSYVAIIHPDVSYDLMGDDDWISHHEYAGSTNIFNGEIGKMHGVRFIETTEAKIFHAEDLVAVGSTNARRCLTVASQAGQVTTVEEAVSAPEALLLVGRYVIIDGYKYTIASAAAGAAGAATITLTETITHAPVHDDVVYPGEAGWQGRDVYSTLILGANAYGTTSIKGGGLENIIKQLGSAGTADPLNQRATVGWKLTKVAERLTETFMIRVETASTFNDLVAN